MRENYSERVSVAITEGMREALELEAKIKGVSLSALLREMLYDRFF